MSKEKTTQQAPSYTLGHRELNTLYTLARTGLASQTEKLDDQTNAVCWALVNKVGQELKSTVATMQEESKGEPVKKDTQKQSVADAMQKKEAPQGQAKSASEKEKPMKIAGKKSLSKAAKKDKAYEE